MLDQGGELASDGNAAGVGFLQSVASAMKLYTTGQVSKLCNVATSTVNKWFDSGQLKGFRVPGSRHRRIPHDSLVEFLKRHGVPAEAIEQLGLANVLIVSRDEGLVERLRRQMTTEPLFRVAVAHHSFEAGLQAESLSPDCVVVDFAMGHDEAWQICRHLRSSPRLADVILIALLPEGNRPPGFDDGGVTEVFHKPFDPALLVQRIRSLVGARKHLD